MKICAPSLCVILKRISQIYGIHLGSDIVGKLRAPRSRSGPAEPRDVADDVAGIQVVEILRQRDESAAERSGVPRLSPSGCRNSRRAYVRQTVNAILARSVRPYAPADARRRERLRSGPLRGPRGPHSRVVTQTNAVTRACNE